jgi:hypothetical protein
MILADGVDFNCQSRFEYTFHSWNFGRVRTVARSLHLIAIDFFVK